MAKLFLMRLGRVGFKIANEVIVVQRAGYQVLMADNYGFTVYKIGTKPWKDGSKLVLCPDDYAKKINEAVEEVQVARRRLRALTQEAGRRSPLARLSDVEETKS